MTAASDRFAFFRQSGWMMVATTSSGLFMFAVHLFAPWMPAAEYGLFGTLLQLMNLMMIPALGLQTVFAQQTAAAVTDERRNALRGTVRALLFWSSIVWLSAAVGVFLLQDRIVDLLAIRNPAALWATFAIGLPQLWLPILLGLLQGSMSFLWLGWVNIMNGAGRFVAVAIIVVLLGGHAAGAVTGALLGLASATALAAYHTRAFWKTAGAGFRWGSWLRRLVPLTLGLGVSQFMLAADMILVRALFPADETGFYAGAGMIGRGLVIFTAPLVWVMFPRIVQSLARDSGTDVLKQALSATALIGGATATGLTLFAWCLPSLLDAIARLDSSASWIITVQSRLAPRVDALGLVARLIPWFVWCMLPLGLANVLVNNLLAREQYRAIPWLMLVGAAYATALTVWNHTLVTVIQTLGVFSLILLAVAAAFTRAIRAQNRPRLNPDHAPAHNPTAPARPENPE